MRRQCKWVLVHCLPRKRSRPFYSGDILQSATAAGRCWPKNRAECRGWIEAEL